MLTVPNSSKQNGQIVFIKMYIFKVYLQQDRTETLNIQFTDDDRSFINCLVNQFDILRKKLANPPSFNQIKRMANSFL